ncbi:MAG: L,D-transpeptidase [Chthoniobacterales bacterium]|nr:L,D-transpeptidase [Chthoniobacterales bacterium]
MQLKSKRLSRVCALGFILLASNADAAGFGREVFVSVPDQELALLDEGKPVARYPVSTSKFGIGDGVGTYRTPLGRLFVSGKIGDRLPSGSVIKRRLATGEVLAPNAAGRDPIVSRVLWLRGAEDQNRNAHDRCIYIHGTAEEERVGRRASFGCVRMRSKDVIALYSRVHIGTRVTISEKRLSDLLPAEAPTLLARDY